MVARTKDATSSKMQDEVRVRRSEMMGEMQETAVREKAEITVEDVKAYIESHLRKHLDQVETMGPGIERAEPTLWWDLFTIGLFQTIPPSLQPSGVIRVGETAFIATILVLNPLAILPGPISPKDIIEGFAPNVDINYRTGNLTTWSLADAGLQINSIVPLSPGGGLFGGPFYVDVQSFTPTVQAVYEMNVSARILGMPPAGAAPFGGFATTLFDMDDDPLLAALGLPSTAPGFHERAPFRFQSYVPS